jgi:ribosomal protein L44E
MPRYYCDYCDAHLTHDSNSVRKQHNAGFKHKVRERSARRARSSRPSAPVAANA